MQMPKGYWVTTYRSIKDPDKLAAYAKLAPVALAPFGAKYIVRGAAVAASEAAVRSNRFATPCDLALRLVGGRPAGIATWSPYPSIAAAPVNPRIDVMGQRRTLTPHCCAALNHFRWCVGLPRGTLLDSFRSIVRSLLASSEIQMDGAQEPLLHDYPRTSSSACTGRLE